MARAGYTATHTYHEDGAAGTHCHAASTTSGSAKETLANIYDELFLSPLSSSETDSFSAIATSRTDNYGALPS